jgi:hypothetical protein
VTAGDRSRWFIEMRFREPEGGALGELFGVPALPLIGFVTAAGFLATFFYLRAVLRHAGPGRAGGIPERVQDTLNSATPGGCGRSWSTSSATP